MSIYIEPKDLKATYEEACQVHDEWIKPFDEYERIAGNKLSKTLSKNMPKVNDGSLAASLLETPMNVLPFMQPGKFVSTTKKKAWIGELANIIWKTKIVPNANTQSDFFSKEQIALYRATKYGAQPRYNFYISNENYSGSDFSLPYIRNLKLEPGKFSDEDCDYMFLDIYYTKLQLQKIIDQQKEEKKIAKEEGRKPDTSWNIKNLQKLVDMALTTKEMKDQNINEREKQVSVSGIKTTVCFNKGIEAPFYMFSSQLGDDEDNLLREWNNQDPTGALPITMQYCYETLESPYGIGRVELAGPTQNVLDYMTQAHVLATQLGLQPAKKFKGAIDSAKLETFVNQPDNLIILGPNSDLELMQSTSSVYTQFPNNFGLYKSQLQTLQGRTDGSVSATSGNPSFSKTSAGVNQQVERTNSQDNYLRNKADKASARMAEKMMNIHMANMQGTDLLDIAEEDRARLMSAGYFDDNPTTEDIPSITEIPIIYDDLRDTFKFEYDPRPETDNDEKNRWLELLDIVASNPNIVPMIEQSGYQFNAGEAFKKIVSASGAKDVDKVLVKMESDQAAIDPVTGQPIPPATGAPAPGQPGMGTMPELPPMQPPMEQPMEQPMPEGEISLEETMAMYPGADENMAMAIMDARSKGFDEQEIVAFLTGGQQGGNQ